MAIIGTIRKHSWVAVLIVGIAILAFILGDLTKNRGGIPDMGKVNSATLTNQRFNELVAEMENNYKVQQQTAQVPSDVEMQIRDQVWQNFVDETLMDEQTAKLGLQVTAAEVNDMYTGTFIHPYIRQMFTNPQTGQYDLRQVNYWIENFDQLDTAQREQWIQIEKYVREDRAQQKYSNLIGRAFYMPKAIAAKIAEYGATTANVRVVALPFQSVADDEVTLADADYKKYYDEHKAEFRVREELRDVEFVTFPVNPTAQDLEAIENEVKATWAEMQTTSDEEMAFFVNAESDRPYDSSYVRASSFTAPFDQLIEGAAAGTLIEPQITAGEWVMAKVMATAMRPDSLRAGVVYILNSNAGGGITRSDEQAKKLADSVLALLQGNKITFEQAVEQYSDDPKKGETKGDMGWQVDGGYGFLNERLVSTPVGSSFVFEHPQGVGYFVVKVTDKTAAAKKYRVAMITHAITPSAATNRAILSEASKFALANRTLAEFTAAAQQNNMQVRSSRLNKMATNMAGISNARTIVQWAFNEDTKIGDVADQVFECDNMFVVVTLKDVFKEGYATLEQVHPMIEQPVRLEKKAELLMARADEAVKAGQDINSIAVKLNAAVDTLDSVSYNDYYLGRYGMEPKVQCTIAISDKGIAGPVKGANGVYVLNIDSRSEKAEVAVEPIQARLSQYYGQKLRAISQVLRDNAKITDQRNKFF